MQSRTLSLVLVSILGACSDGRERDESDKEDPCVCSEEATTTFETASLECYCAEVGCPRSEDAVQKRSALMCGEAKVYRSAEFFLTDIVIFREGQLIGAYRGESGSVMCGARFVSAGDTSCLDQWPGIKDVLEPHGDPFDWGPDCDDETAGGAGGMGGAVDQCNNIIR